MNALVKIRKRDAEGPEIMEVSEIPESPRHFDVEGGYTTLVRELQIDALEYSCPSYTVFFEDRDGTGCYSVWRNM